MSLELRWVGEDEMDRVAETRMLSFGGALNQRERFRLRIRQERRAKPGDYLLAERGGRAVGTATSLSFTMWVRSGAVPCQGVGHVGVLKTERRKAGMNPGGGSSGVATTIMREVLRKAREREQVVSALMPFRSSFYEHFGYGIVERHHLWTVPMQILPSGSAEGVRFFEPEDLPAVAECRQRVAQAGQCDIERSAETWEETLEQMQEGLMVVDRPGRDGPVRGWMYFMRHNHEGRTVVRALDTWWDQPDDFRRLLAFLGTLRDQYPGAMLTLPADLPLNRLLRESQIPSRVSNHPAAELRTYNRMQVRVLDHRRFLEAIHWPADVRGLAVVAVHECEGQRSTFEIEVDSGRASVRPSDGSAQVECPDHTWAAVACGELPATAAHQLGLLTAGDPSALKLLDALALGPVPFCREGF